MSIFLDTSILVAGLIDFGPQSAPAHSLLHGVAEKTIGPASTAWHCCLEFYSVSTRLPAEYRLSPVHATRLIDEEIFSRMTVQDLPAGERVPLLRAAAHDGIGGGRIYDTHIAEVARFARATVILTDNRRHFLSALRHGIRVETPGEFLTGLKKHR